MTRIPQTVLLALAFTVIATGQASTPAVGVGFKPAPPAGSITGAPAGAPAALSSAGSARAVGVLILMETIS